MLGNAKNLKDSDSALMLSFAAGDGEGFDLLYQRHSESVYRFFYFGTHGDESLAAELFQDVWMTVVRGRARYTNEINFTDWLYHSAWARLHDHIRLHPLVPAKQINSQDQSTVVRLDSYRNSVAPDSADEIASEDIEVDMPMDSIGANDDAKDNAALVVCVENMTPEHKEVILLRYCFAMSLQEISEFLDVSKTMVERCFREAVKVIRSDIALHGSNERVE